MGRYSRTHGKSGNTEQRENSELSCKCLSAKKQYGGVGEDRDFPLYLSSYLSPGASGRREGEDMAPSHHSSNFLEHDLKGCQVH